jgi:hypothetical protein
MTKCLCPSQSEEMFDWLDQHREIIHSFEHTTLDEVIEMVTMFEGYAGIMDGPWLVVLKDEPDDVVFFKMKWC